MKTFSHFSIQTSQLLFISYFIILITIMISLSIITGASNKKKCKRMHPKLFQPRLCIALPNLADAYRLNEKKSDE